MRSIFPQIEMEKMGQGDGIFFSCESFGFAVKYKVWRIDRRLKKT